MLGVERNGESCDVGTKKQGKPVGVWYIVVGPSQAHEIREKCSTTPSHYQATNGQIVYHIPWRIEVVSNPMSVILVRELVQEMAERGYALRIVIESRPV